MELRGTYTHKETVINERQHRIELYSMLLFTLNQEKYMEERQEAKDSYYAGRLLKKVKEGKAKTVKEALLQIEAEDEGLPVYRRFADTIDEAYSAVYNVVDDMLDGKPIEEVEKAIAPFQERFNEAKKELYNLLTEHIQTMLYEHYNKGDKDVTI
mgnify:CR=1 FL=1